MKTTITLTPWLAAKRNCAPTIEGEVEAETDRAILLADGTWIPRSQIVDRRDHIPEPDAESYGRSRTKPWRHQRVAYNLALGLVGCGLWLDMGTGKSKVVVDLVVNTKQRLVLICAPLSVLPVWEREFRLHAAEPFRALVLEKGSTAVRARRLDQASAVVARGGSPLVVVVNYEAVWRGEIRKLIEELPWGVIVADEIHRIKAPNGRASKFLARLGQREHVKHRLGLSGTPLPHSPLDAYAIYRFLDPAIFGTSFFRFKARHAILGGFNGKQVVRFQRLDELERKMASISYRVESRDVLDLPETMDEWRWVDLGPRATKIHAELEADLVAEIGDGEITASNVLVKLLRLQQVTGGVVTRDDGVREVVSDAKRRAVSELLEDLRPRPAVLFARFLADLDQARDAGEAAGYTVGELSGRTKAGLEDFRSGGCDLLVVQIQAGGVGIDLTRASHAIYWSTGFSLGDYLQSRARLHRPGQTRGVVYYHICARGTVDERVALALRKREDLVASVLGALRGGK